MTSAVAHSGQVTITVTSAPDIAAATATSSSTLSLIYIYSTSTTAQPTGASASTSNNATRVSGGVIAGIVISCIAFLVLMSLVLFCYSRKIARKRRAEMASFHQSRLPAPSRAYSPAATAHDTMQEAKRDRSSRYSRSLDAMSAATGPTSMEGTVLRSLKTPSPMPSRPPPVELASPTNSSNSRALSAHRPRAGVAEVYGSYTHPIELQAGSTTNLVSTNSEERRMKAFKVPSSRGGGSYRGRQDSDVESRGYMNPDPEWHHSSGRRGSGNAEYGADSANTDGASIHIYYRSSAVTISEAMSHASFAKSASTRASMRSSATPYMSHTSLADTTR